MHSFGPIVLCSTLLLGACAAPPPPKPRGPTPEQQRDMLKVEVAKRTRELMAATDRLRDAQSSIEEQKRRLQLICVDYPDHQSCDLHSAVSYARDAFCDDDEFTAHVDDVGRGEDLRVRWRDRQDSWYRVLAQQFRKSIWA